MDTIRDYIDDAAWTSRLVTIAGIGIAIALVYYVARRIVLPIIYRAARRSPFKWDDILLDKPLLHRLALFAPGWLLWVSVRFTLDLSSGWEEVLGRITSAILAGIAVSVLSSLLSDVNTLYERTGIAAARPIKGYLQVVRILMYVFAAIFVFAILSKKSPLLLVSGLGAMMAVILLIFRTTILSLVASVQVTQNDMIRVGDWIEMPQFGADGTVEDIALNAIKVQNWDMTYVSIPTYKFMEESFVNWRGMAESGGRRIKRSLFIDMSSVRFLTAEEIERLSTFAPLTEYMEKKRTELSGHNARLGADRGIVADPRRLTNVGTFRAYISSYLTARPDIHTEDMTFLIRQRPPGAHGLPLEIYVFVTDTSWVSYEGVQSDIFDHLLAMVPEFGLRVFQSPSGTDVRSLEDGNDRIAGAVWSET